MFRDRADLVIQAIVAVIVVLCATVVALIPSISTAQQIIPGDALIALYASTLGYVFGAVINRQRNGGAA